MIGEHYDVAIRLAPLQDSQMISQKIFAQRILILADLALCARHGMPHSLEDLKALLSVTQISGEWGRIQQFRHDSSLIDFIVPQHFTITSASAVKNASLTGYGYSLLPDFMVAEEIEHGRLIQLLPDYEPVARAIHALYAGRRHTPQKIRALLDFLVSIFWTTRGNVPQFP